MSSFAGVTRTFGRRGENSAYEILGIAHDVEASEAKKAYHRQLKVQHPDKGGDPEKFRQLKSALNTVLADISLKADKSTSHRITELSAHTSDPADHPTACSEPADGSAATGALTDPQERADEARRRGNSEYASGHVAAAELLYSEALRWAPDDPILWSNRSAARYALERYEGAHSDARRAVELKPRWAKAHHRMGVALLRLGRARGAAECLRRAAALDPALEAARSALQQAEAALAASACRALCRGHCAPVHAAAFRPASRLFATASSDSTARIWSDETGECKHVLEGHGDKVTGVQWSNGGALLATASLDRTVCIWDVPPEDKDAAVERVCQLAGHEGRVTCFAFACGDTRLVTGSTDSTGAVWEVASGRLLHRLRGHSQLIPSLALSPDHSVLATVSGDGTIMTWSVEDGECVDTIEWSASGAVTQCAFTPRGLGSCGGSLLVTAHIDLKRDEGRILMWDVDRSSTAPLRAYCRSLPSAAVPYRGRIEDMDMYPAHASPALSSPSEDGSVDGDGEVLLAVGVADGTFAVADVESGVTLFSSKDEHEGAASVYARRASGGPGQPPARALAPPANVTRVRFAPGGAVVASTGADHCIKVWEADTGELLHTLRGHTGAVKALTWSPDGASLVSASEDSTVRVWRCEWTPGFGASRQGESGGTSQAPVGPAPLDPMAGPTIGPMLGPDIGPEMGATTAPAAGPAMGPMMGPDIGPEMGPDIGPEMGPMMGPVVGPEMGAALGPVEGPQVCPEIGPAKSVRDNPCGVNDWTSAISGIR